MANNHPEVIISAGFHGGFDFFQESCVEQMLSGLFQRSNTSMSWMQRSFPVKMSVVTTILDLNDPSGHYRKYRYCGAPSFFLNPANVSFLVSSVVKRIMQKLAGVG